MFKNVIFVLLYHRHKLLDAILLVLLNKGLYICVSLFPHLPSYVLLPEYEVLLKAIVTNSDLCLGLGTVPFHTIPLLSVCFERRLATFTSASS
jgi:hypothetical protein